MYVAALRVELRVPAVQSLKEKRHIVKSLISQLTRTFTVGVAEVGHQDLWQRATLGVAVVAPQLGQLDRVLLQVEKAIREREDVEVLEVGVSHLEDPQ